MHFVKQILLWTGLTKPDSFIDKLYFLYRLIEINFNHAKSQGSGLQRDSNCVGALIHISLCKAWQFYMIYTTYESSKKYTNSSVNADWLYGNSNNINFQKVLLPHLKTTNFALSENIYDIKSLLTWLI